MGLNWYHKNKEKVLAKAKTPEVRAERRAYYAATIERRRELDMARHRRNRAKRLAAMKAYRIRNAAKIKVKRAAKFKETYQEKKAHLLERKHRTKRNATHRKWQHANRDKTRAYERKYMAKNPHIRTAKNNRRRARMLGVATDAGAEAFIKLVRSKRRIPCYYCGKVISGRDAHIDHIQAVSKDGNHVSSNLCASCEFCNCSKCDRTLDKWVPPTNQPMLSL